LAADHDDFVFALQSLDWPIVRMATLRRPKRCSTKRQRFAARHRHRMLGPILVSKADLLCATRLSHSGPRLLEEATTLIESTYPDEPWRKAILDNSPRLRLAAVGTRQAGEKLMRQSLPVIQARWGPRHCSRDDALGALTDVGR
jgi:hypothetical protein